MPKNAKKKPYKKQEFDTYVAWKSLPAYFRGKPREFLEKFGIKNEITILLLSIRTQKEFAEKFGINDLGTLTDWNKKIEKEGLVRKSHELAQK